LNAEMRWGRQPQRARACALAALALGAIALSQASAAPLARSFSETRPVNWVSVAAGRPASVWAETAAGGSLSADGGQSFHAPLSANAFRNAQVAQASLLADGKTLVAMPTVWSAQQFTPPRRSADGGATWTSGRLRGKDAHYDFGNNPGFAGESPVTADPTDARTAWFCQGNLYVTHDAGRSWAVARPRLERPWHCTALAISPGRQHTLILLVQSRSANAERVPGRLLRSVDGGASWRRLRAPRFPQLDYNGHALAFDPAAPATVLMLAADGAAPGALYRSLDAGLSWQRVRPAGAQPGAVVEEFAFAADGRALALVRAGTARALYASSDGGARWAPAPPLALGSKSPAVYASPLAASGTAFLLGTNERGFWRLAPAAARWVAP
jgi:photosystem II stability/assembly factor-like uncharacterized protein